MRGIDPRTSRMQSERSTIWATPPTQVLVFRVVLLKICVLRHCSYLFGTLCSAPIFCRTDSSIFKRLYNIKVKGVNMSHTKFYLIWSKISGSLRASKITIFLHFSVKLLYCWYLVLGMTSYFHETCRTKKAKKANFEYL